MRFYAVRTEAIQHTFRALRQQQGQRPLPSRVLLASQLYGHLQYRADANGLLSLTIRELAVAWHLHPRQLRAALQDLQCLGWLRYQTTPRGTSITLLDPSEPPIAPAPQAPDPEGPGPQGRDLQGSEPGDRDPMAPVPEGQKPKARAAAAAPVASSQLLLQRFAGLYNRHRPAEWPAYRPRSAALAGRLRRALTHAGGADRFWALLPLALAAVPPFWRTTYPQGRSGADCAAVLFSTDRGGAGLGVEFWHVFSWSQVQPAPAIPAAGATALPRPQPEHEHESESEPELCLAVAQRLLAWDGHHWRGQGVEALRLPPEQKRRYAELLEAAGYGVPGTAADQYGSPSAA